jgi:hypothetical protein
MLPSGHLETIGRNAVMENQGPQSTRMAEMDKIILSFGGSFVMNA